MHTSIQAFLGILSGIVPNLMPMSFCLCVSPVTVVTTIVVYGNNQIHGNIEDLDFNYQHTTTMDDPNTAKITL